MQTTINKPETQPYNPQLGREPNSYTPEFPGYNFEPLAEVVRKIQNEKHDFRDAKFGPKPTMEEYRG